MHVIVLGAGVIGTTAAYYLARRGASVTVVERRSAPAQETSYANAGQVSPGYSTPWAAPGIPVKALAWLLQKHAPLSIRPDGTLHQLSWLYQLMINCSADRYGVNKERMLRLAEYSRDCLRLLRAETGIAYEERTGGTLQVFRTKAQFDAVRRDTAVLDEYGVPYELLDADHLATAEPALAAVKHKLTGGLRLPNDETGDCQLFTSRLAQQAQQLGVRFLFDRPVDGLLKANRRVTAIRMGHETLEADCYVVALGSYSRGMLAPLGLDLPVYPVKGYSLTAPIVNDAASPVSTILDETYKVAITRFDHRVRIGGMAELGGFDLRLNPRRRQTLEKVASDLFPGACELATAQFWTGLRPMTPDSTPIVGGTAYRNLFINTGHGTLGWTMACGSGQLIADLLSGHRPAIRTDGLDLSRYGAAAVRRSTLPVADGARAG